MPDYSRRARQQHVELHLDGKYTERKYSLREIARDIQETFGLERPVSPATVTKDIATIRGWQEAPKETIPELEELLEPDNFPAWREKYFRAPGTDTPYETPKHQLAWFRLFVSLALKQPMPEWAIDYLEIRDLDINNWVQNPERVLNLFLLAPPRHGKSDLLLHACIWTICRNPNIRIMWIGGTADVSEIGTAYVKEELELNEGLVRDYGPFQGRKWSDGSFSVVGRTVRTKTGTLTALGKGSGILSRDADLIVVDDFVDLKASESPAQVGRDVRWLKSQLMTRRQPWTPLFGIGSHQPAPTGDAYSEMLSEDTDSIRFVEIKAHDYSKCREGESDDERHGEWCILWNNQLPYWFLEAQRDSLGDIMFEVCYNQEPTEGYVIYFPEEIVRAEYPQPEMDNERGVFRDADLRFSKPGVLDRTRSFNIVPYCCEKKDIPLLVALGFDPAAGENKRSSESALTITGGCRFCGRRYLIDYWHGRQSPEAHPDTILNYVRSYPEIQRVRIEINAYQKALARDPRLVSQQGPLRFLLEEWTTTDKKRDPFLGIPVLSRHIQTAKFSIPAAMPADKQKAEEFLKALIRWPKEPNDMPMSWWLADLSVAEMIEAVNVHVPEYMPGFESMSPHLQSQVVEFDTTDINFEQA